MPGMQAETAELNNHRVEYKKACLYQDTLHILGHLLHMCIKDILYVWDN